MNRPSRSDSRAGNPALGFVLRLLLIWGALVALNSLLPSITHGAIIGTLGTTRLALNALGFVPHAVGDNLVLGAASIRVVSECTPVFPFLILAAAMLAFPAPWSARAVGLSASFALLWLYNIARILGTMVLLAWSPGLFDLVQGLLWQAATILAVIGMFLLWVRHVPPPTVALPATRKP